MTHPRGRLTTAQRRGLQELLPLYGFDDDPDSVSQWARGSLAFGVEIGFGMGDALYQWACDVPDWNLLGIDIYAPGIGALANRLQLGGVNNVRILESRAEDAIASRLPLASIDEVRIFFPDPWPKKRHHKRRLIQPEFCRLLVDRLKPNGLLWFVTDWVPYAEWAREIFFQTPGLMLCEDEGAGAAPRSETKFERRGLRLGHEITELRYRRTGEA